MVLCVWGILLRSVLEGRRWVQESLPSYPPITPTCLAWGLQFNMNCFMYYYDVLQRHSNSKRPLGPLKASCDDRRYPKFIDECWKSYKAHKWIKRDEPANCQCNKGGTNNCSGGHEAQDVWSLFLNMSISLLSTMLIGSLQSCWRKFTTPHLR